MKNLLFTVLFARALLVYLIMGRWQRKPEGIPGGDVFMFYDERSGQPDRPHGVIAFVIPPGLSTTRFKTDMWGPLGYASWTKFRGMFLYNRDEWGSIQEYQTKDIRNGPLRDLVAQHPGQTILLAGVRKVFGKHIWPLNDPSRYILIWDQ